MAEAIRPETKDTIEKFVSSELNYNKFNKAMSSLISLNLIVVKPEKNSPDLYDLHPLVRQFVRTRFERNERDSYIKVVLNQYDMIIGAIGVVLTALLPFSLIERWSQKTELQISAGLYDEAFATLSEVEGALLGAGHNEEFIRISRLLLESIEWEIAGTKYGNFDRLVASITYTLNTLGEYDDADAIIRKYEQSIPQKTARYINYCDIRAEAFWLRGEFADAIEWASKGVTLKEDTGVDTVFDCEHILALAQRDAGQPAKALEFFSKEHDLAEICDPNHIAENVNGPTFGNIGRCLQFMGQFDDALTCYKKSAKLLENDDSSHRSRNQAYARQWIGETLKETGSMETAMAFFVDALAILESDS